MPSFCCVPNCNQKGYSTSSGEKVSFFNFPKEPLIRKQWIHAIHRDEGKDFVITERTKVCSLHFRSEDLRKSINGRIYIKEGGIPSKFDSSGPSPKKRKAPSERQPLPAKKKLLTEDNSASVNTEVQETIEMSASEPSTSFEEDTCKTPDLERQIAEYLYPGDNCSNIRPRGSVTDVPEDFYNSDSDDEENVQASKKGRGRKRKPLDEFFIVLCRLRRGFSEKHLAHLYGVAQSTVSRIFVPWINYMYLKFGQICIWPSKEVVQATMPADFKEKFPTTRVIIDYTEVPCEMPSSLLLNSELFSSYKNHVTLKGPVGIAPSGAITFISQLYTGSISDREIVIRSGFLSQKFENGDTVMADKGFQIADILPLGVKLNIPPFLGANTLPKMLYEHSKLLG